MQLIHTEIDAVPGGNVLPPQTGGGRNQTQCGILRLNNSRSDRVRAFRVYLEAARPELQARFKRWYRLTPQPPADGDADAAARADDVEPGMVTVHIGAKKSRNIHIEFRMDKTPEAEAGRYDYRVVIEAIPDAATPVGAKVPTKKLPGILYIHPYWDWNLQIQPQYATVNWGKRRTRLTAEVINRGNDWLYCQLTLPNTPQRMRFERDAPPTDPEQRKTVLVAVPPAQFVAVPSAPPKVTNGIRRVDFEARPDRTPFIGGNDKPTEIAVTAARLQAPSVPPLPASPEQVTNAVLVGAASDAASDTGNGKLAYQPVISSDITNFIGLVVNNFKLILATIAAIAVAAWALALLIVNATGFKIKTLGSDAKVDSAGKYWVRVKIEQAPFWVMLQGGPSKMKYFAKEIGKDGAQSELEEINEVVPPPKSLDQMKKNPLYDWKNDFKQAGSLAVLNLSNFETKKLKLYVKPNLFYLSKELIPLNGEVTVGTPTPGPKGCKVQAEEVGPDGILKLVAIGCEFDEETRPKKLFIGGKAVTLRLVDKTTLEGKIPPDVALDRMKEAVLDPPIPGTESIPISPKPPTPSPVPSIIASETPGPIPPPETPMPEPTPTPDRYEYLLNEIRKIGKAYWQNGYDAREVEGLTEYANELVSMESKRAKVLGYASLALAQLAEGDTEKGEGNLSTVQQMLKADENLKEALTVVLYKMAQRAYFAAKNDRARTLRAEEAIKQDVQENTPFN